MKDELIKELKKAIADEWFAFIQYINGAAIATGFMRDAIAKDLRENAMEELKHIDMLNERIQQLGVLPPLDPKKWYNISSCGIILPKSLDTIQLAHDSLRAEECAISAYRKIADMARDLADHVTYNIVCDILEDEEKHKFEMEMFIQDFNQCMKRMAGGHHSY